MKPMLLLKNCDLYTPMHIGMRDVLIAGGRIEEIGPDLSRYAAFADTTDMAGRIVCPGLIDMHVHVTGGGGEQGPASRTPEIRASELFLSGVTTVVGLLGTDGLSRSLENLLFKCRALEEEGLTTLMLTGSYRYPSPTLTGDVERDIALIDKIIGVKIAVSDHRGSGITGEELIRLGSEARLGGMLSGKPGLVVMHMGASEARLAPLFYALAHSDVPAGNYLPTHCCRSPELVSEAVHFTQMGGTIDFTADDCDAPIGTAAAIADALQKGADPARITMSSDACGSQPKFDETGACIGLTYTTPKTLLSELKRLVQNQQIPLEIALRFLTENPARVLGLSGQKGILAPGADADVAVLTADFALYGLLARGRVAVQDGRAVMKGRFE